MLHKYDLFITVVCCIILIYLHGEVFSVNFTYVYFISNDLDTDIDIETHDNSHLIYTGKLHKKVIIHLYNTWF